MIACIPTKGRPQTKTHKLFEASGIQTFHFIEPHQMNQYDVPGMVDIKADNQGISYARNFILEWATEQGHDTIILCDDDVINFGKYEGKTIRHKNADIWFEVENAAKNLPFEMFGINYIQKSWSSQKPHSINSGNLDVCVLLKPKKIEWRYSRELVLKVDRDFVLQTIKNGHGVFRFNRLFFECPDIGTNPGGLQQEYKRNAHVASVYKMVNKWKPFLAPKNTKHGLDIKYDWKAFAKHYGKLHR